MKEATKLKEIKKSERQLLRQKTLKENEKLGLHLQKRGSWTPASYDMDDHNPESFLAQKLFYSRRLLDKNKDVKAPRKQMVYEV